MAVYAEFNADGTPSFVDTQAPANMNIAPSDADILKASAAAGFGPVSDIQHIDFTGNADLGSVFGLPTTLNLGASNTAPQPSNFWLYAGAGAIGVVGLVALMRRR